MKPVFVFPDGMCLSGVMTWSMDICRRLNESGENVAVIKHPDYGVQMSTRLPSDMQVVRCQHSTLPNGPNLDLRDIRQFTKDYRRALPGTVIPNWSRGAYATCSLISQEDPESLRVIGYAHSDENYYYELLYYYEPLIHRFVAVSDEIAAKLANRMPHREKDILIRPYAVNVDRGLQRSYSRQDVPLQLIYAGRIIELQKRVTDLVRLAEALTKEGVQFCLRIVGDGPDKESLVNRVGALEERVRRQIKLVGAVGIDEMPKLWLSSDILILVSDYEGTSISMLEAMANGCVPVVTNVSGMARLIQPGLNGFLAEVGNTAEMVRILKMLDRDRPKLESAGAGAFDAIVERFSTEDYLQWLQSMLEHVWQEAPRSWPSERPILPELAEPVHIEEKRSRRWVKWLRTQFLRSRNSSF
ncbi:MAG: glycosyltransferase family 4 protein [Fuerstiella sp.]|nr:glycosyltransferase family 4 protein [Fuerstiella sp.]